MIKLWKWLFKLSKKNLRKEHLSKYGCNLKCPHCREWLSISGLNHKHKVLSEPDFGWHIRCGQCEEDSYWNMVAAPIPLHCDEKGDPY